MWRFSGSGTKTTFFCRDEILLLSCRKFTTLLIIYYVLYVIVVILLMSHSLNWSQYSHRKIWFANSLTFFLQLCSSSCTVWQANFNDFLLAVRPKFGGGTGGAGTFSRREISGHSADLSRPSRNPTPCFMQGCHSMGTSTSRMLIKTFNCYLSSTKNY